MSHYNVSLIEYPTGYQLRFYNKPIRYSEDIKNNSIEFDCSDVRTTDECYVDELARAEHSQKSSINRTINTIYELARSNVWTYFLTLTIDPKKIDNSVDNYDQFSKTIRKYFNNLKQNYAPDLKYLIVPELHKNGKTLHFHAIISDVGDIKFLFSGKVSVGKYLYDFDKCPWGRKFYNMPLWSFGWSTATKVQDTCKVAGYICKYITKDLLATVKNKRRFWASLNLNRPKTRYFLSEPQFMESLINRYDNAIMYSKDVLVYDAHLEIKYYEFNNEFDVSDIKESSLDTADEYDKFLVSHEEMEKIRNRLKQYQKEESKIYSNGFKRDSRNVGKNLFND